MASRAQQKERQREERLAAERRAAEERAKTRRVAWITGSAVAVLAVVGAVVIATTSGGGAGSGAASASRPAAPPSAAQLSALPRPIAANIAQANRIIDTSIQSKLTSLRGVPVVVNQWASWCPNCKAEFGFFQQLAKRYQRQVAFVGLDSQDSRGDAQSFLRGFPVTYPSIYDERASQAHSIGGGQGWPTTIYFNKAGQRTYVRPGGYTTLQSLEADIQQYALNG